MHLNFSAVVHQGRLHLSPEEGDGHDYDVIALNLARGLGFGHYWSDPEWRAPYESRNQDGRYNLVLARTGSFHKTAYRPPLLPALLALLYKLAGRNFALWRAVNCLIVGLATGFIFIIGHRLGGWAGGFLAVLLSLLDPVPKLYAGMFLTEGLAMLFISALAWSMLNLFLRANPTRYVLTGVLLALAVLTRSIFALWIPIVFALALWIEIRLSGHRGRRSLLMLCTALLVLMPWFVRNCIALDAFMPLGTQGGINLPSGYSDGAVSTDGHWSGSVKKRILGGFDGHYMDILLERDQARLGLKKATEWILNNPYLTAKLFYLKIRALWWSSSKYQIFLLMLVLSSLLILWRREEAIVLYGLLVANTLAVGLTWSVGGRFLIPVYPILYSLAAIVLLKMFTRSKAFSGMMDRIEIPLQKCWAVYGKVIGKLGYLLAVAVVLLSFAGLAILFSFTAAYGPPSIPQAIERTVVAEARPEHLAEVNFDDELMFLGYDVEDDAIQKKSDASWVKKYLGVYAELFPEHRTTFRIACFWQCMEEMEKDYTLVTQLEGHHGKTYRIDQSHQGATGVYPTSSWREGEIIREEYELEL
jgi:4-amino-4-deoxy-L-arabinose transferase-like glycosyltransferase